MFICLKSALLHLTNPFGKDGKDQPHVLSGRAGPNPELRVDILSQLRVDVLSQLNVDMLSQLNVDMLNYFGVHRLSSCGVLLYQFLILLYGF